MNELARLTGIQKADLARIENGRMVPTWEEYTKVAAVLGLPGVGVIGPSRVTERTAAPT